MKLESKYNGFFFSLRTYVWNIRRKVLNTLLSREAGVRSNEGEVYTLLGEGPVRSIINSIPHWRKWPPFRLHFQMHFHEWFFTRISLKCVPKGPIGNKSAFVLVIGATRQQAVSWTNGDTCNWRTYSALGGDALRRHDMEMLSALLDLSSGIQW